MSEKSGEVAVLSAVVIQESSPSPEDKIGLVEAAMREVGGVYDGARSIRFVNRDYVDQMRPLVGSLHQISGNADPRKLV